MNKKLIIWFSIMVCMTFGNTLYAQAALSLDDAVRNTAGDIETRLAQGSKVAVLNFNAPSEQFSKYVLDELMTFLVKNGRVIVVDRANLELIRREMDFQMSGDVSDDSAQAIGRMLGAQTIISGQLDDVGDFYRMRFRAIEVETAVIQAQTTYNIRKDNQVITLMGGTPSRTRGLTFSTGRKVGAGFLNLLVGIGSFTMGDWVGGLMVSGMQAGSIVLMIVANQPTGSYTEFGVTSYDYDNFWMMYPGIGLLAAGAVTGFVRPFAYDISLSKKRGTYTGFESNPMKHISLAPVLTSNEIGLGVLYSASW